MAGSDDDFRARLLATFEAEAAEHLEVLNANLLALASGLEPEQADQAVEVTFREMHTLKGASRSVGLKEIEAVCQECESVLSAITQGRSGLDPETVERLQEQVDLVARLVSTSTSASGPGVAPSSGHVALPLPATGTVRLATARLDDVLFQTEDLLVQKLAAAERVRDARSLAEGVARARLRRGRGNGADRARGDEAELKLLETEARTMLTRLVGDQHRIAGAVDRLHDEMRRLRMTPASAVLDLFPRMVRELAGELRKEVQWTARGADLEIDRRVLDAIKDPLVHLIRNAVDHGIELPDVRVGVGKDPCGQLTVTVTSREDGQVEILVEDDGAGIHPGGVREAALRTRLLSAEQAAELSDAEVLDVVYRSGFSTSRIITDISGRGLGLTIAKERVVRLGGQIELESTPGLGTRVRMFLPATITTFRGVLVEDRGRRFLFPVAAVERTIAITPGELRVVEGRDAIRWNDVAMPVVRLGDVLGLPDDRDGRAERDESLVCVVIVSGDERVGLLVEEIKGDQEMLVKELVPPLVRLRYVAQVGLLGTGQIVPVLRPGDLVGAVNASGRRPAAPAVEGGRQLVVLVVDDAITTRVMETTLLEAAGYRVQAAVDGVDAWTALKTGEFDLVVSDVDMPRMNGFELTARIRGDAKLADLPVVLVTALESREDKERGVEAGANAYVVKSSFDQSNLLDMIQRLV